MDELSLVTNPSLQDDTTMIIITNYHNISLIKIPTNLEQLCFVICAFLLIRFIQFLYDIYSYSIFDTI